MNELRRTGGPGSPTAAVGTYHSRPSEGLEPLDLLDDAAVDAFLDRWNPGTIYLPAFQPHVDWVEENPAESRRLNVDAPKRLFARLRGTGVKLVYYSTDYVFDGLRGPYREEDPVNPISEYGRQKLEMERAALETLPGALVLRVAVVFGWEAQPKNFAQRALRSMRQGGILRVPKDQIANPTFAPELAKASVRMVELGAEGVYHLCGRELCDREVFAAELATVFRFDPRERVVGLTTAELKQKAPRPLLAGMVVEKAESLLGNPLAGYRETLRTFRDTEPPGEREA